MERPNSVILLGIEQATKKVRNKELEEDILRDLAMEDVVLEKVSFNDKRMANMNSVVLEPIGSFQVIDTENDYFLVKFSMNQDYNKALTEAHWVVYGNYLTIQPWSQDFSKKERHPSKIIV
ncbi:hypothetical protein PVK06_001483 [Gossypium arboreum]|uniref:DUF4283 domain-containing protein n=1 Tax=Gossypium arboreum TaxID=29729 RepID=A0ABR0R247_GOSAR|nr:hypothetical protein PVK06_001483 [Gossypium arboreum]